jgi:Zinc-finger of C2H2 type
MVYTCEICQYTTSVKNSFSVHMNSKRHLAYVSSPAQFRCSECDKGFNSTRGLRKHRLKCQSKSTTDTSNAIIPIELSSQALIETAKRELRAEMQVALVECLKKQAVLDSSNTLAMFQSFFNPILSNVSTGSHSLVAHDINSNSFNNSSSYMNQLNMFLATCKNVPNMTDYIDSMNITKNQLQQLIFDPCKPIGECMANLLSHHIKPIPPEERSIHYVPGDDERPPVYMVKHRDQWVGERVDKVRREIEDTEQYADDSDIDSLDDVDRSTLPTKSAMNIVSKKFGDKIYDSCKTHFPGKESKLYQASSCTGRSQFLGALTRKDGIQYKEEYATKALKGPTG